MQTPEKYGNAPQLSDLNSRELQATMDLICVFLWKVLNLLGFFLARDNNYLRLQEMYPLSQMYKRAMDCSWLRLLKSCYHTHTDTLLLSATVSPLTSFSFIQSSLKQVFSYRHSTDY